MQRDPPGHIGGDVRILLNERPIDVPEGTRVADVAREHKPNADVFVLNGFPAPGTTVLRGEDHLVLIRKGEAPRPEELDALLSARHTPGVAERLRTACVAVAGLGGLGSNVALALCRVGVGRLLLCDFDVVEPSNLNRQQYFLDQIGRP
jgi:sulfur carrier protein ThiS adenylyltransferase